MFTGTNFIFRRTRLPENEHLRPAAGQVIFHRRHKFRPIRPRRFFFLQKVVLYSIASSPSRTPPTKSLSQTKRKTHSAPAICGSPSRPSGHPDPVLCSIVSSPDRAPPPKSLSQTKHKMYPAAAICGSPSRLSGRPDRQPFTPVGASRHPDTDKTKPSRWTRVTACPHVCEHCEHHSDAREGIE